MRTKLIIIILAILFISYLALNKFSANLTLNEIKGYIRSFGPLAPAVYILMFTLVPLTMIPNSVLAISAGAIFGIYYGTMYTVIGALAGSTLAFAISRYFGKEVTEKIIRHKAKWFHDQSIHNGFMVIFLLRLIPIIPFDVISYGAGLSKIKYLVFLNATLLGIIPGVLIYSNIGDKVFDTNSLEFWLSIGLLVALILLSNQLKKRLALKHIGSTSSALCRSDYQANYQKTTMSN